MQELILMFAEIMPMDEIVKMLEEKILAWRVDPTEDNLKGIEMTCILFASKQVVNKNGLEKSVTSMQRSKQIHERFNDLS